MERKLDETFRLRSVVVGVWGGGGGSGGGTGVGGGWRQTDWELQGLQVGCRVGDTQVKSWMGV